MMAYTNRGRTAERNSGRKPKPSERGRRTLKRIMSKSHKTTATKVAAELSIYLEDPVSTKTFRRELHKSCLHGGDAIAKPLITEKQLLKAKNVV